MPGPPEKTDTSAPEEQADLDGEVLEQIREILADVIGEDYVTQIAIGPETAFRADLDIESIEFVALGEALRAIYGDRIDFVDWLTTMEIDDIIDLTVGDLAAHIVRELRP